MKRESDAALEQGRGVSTLVVWATLRVKGSSTGTGGAPVERGSGGEKGEWCCPVAGQGCGHRGGWGHNEEKEVPQ